MGGVNTCKHHQYHAPNKTKPIEYQSRLWALVGGVDIPLHKGEGKGVGGERYPPLALNAISGECLGGQQC